VTLTTAAAAPHDDDDDTDTIKWTSLTLRGNWDHQVRRSRNFTNDSQIKAADRRH